MKSIVVIIIQSLLMFQTAVAQINSNCSSISLISSDTVVFGRNHDVDVSNGLLVINPRNVYKEGFEFPEENIPKWTSKYASITLNVFGVGFAICGMNEKGLSIGHLGFSEAKYPPKDDRPVIDQIHFITYMLDNCSTTSEVIDSANKIRISDESITREHYYICDAKGQTAILEPIEGEWVLYTNETMPFPILSNDNYKKSINYLNNYQGFSGLKNIPERNFGVEEIMAMGATYIKNYQNEKKKNIISSSFELLNNIGFNKYPPPDSIDVPSNYGTQITTVFDLKNLAVYFRTKSNTEIKKVNFSNFQPDCPEPFMMMEVETETTGVVDDLFENYTYDRNLNFVKEHLEKSNVSYDVIEFLATYPESFKCK
jgi:penicillin V acylase-like amidase (Ntn superfamily)